jgi:AraC family transcriptional regulator, transcriptional activator of the genes for pyochelin and ferripyochelin receptors
MSATASSFDFSRLLDSAFAEKVVPPGCVPAQGVYGGRDGLQFRTTGRNSQLVQEVVQVTEGALLLASDFLPTGESLHHQVVNDSDWIHIQFRINGDGHERISKAQTIQTPARSCVVIRYPQSSVVTRTNHETESFRMACLLLSPRALTNLLDVRATRLPERTLWIAQEDQLELRASVLPLSSNMRLAVNDVLSCPYRGAARRAYMRAKSLELLSCVVHALDDSAGQTSNPGVTISSLDVTKLDHARRIMMHELECSMTLATLARRVGLNRTKLAVGFKQVYGVSVQAYWRDERLTRARELLQRGEARVTDVALSLGYSELSSFTRAFSRKFGLLPRSVRFSKK